MDQTEKSGSDRVKYLIGFVVLAAVVLLGISAYFGANSAKDTVGKLGNALDSAGAGNFPANMPSLNGSAEPKVPSAGGLSPNGSVATGSGGEAQVPQVKAPAKEVTIDFLYADWCPHCQVMKPIVAALVARLPADRLEVRYWNEASRSSNATVAAVYADYSAKGYFQGFPTFVANWEDYRVGEMSETAFKAWVCSKFSAPKPTGC